MTNPLIGQDQELTFADYFKLAAETDDVLAHFSYSFEAKKLALPSTSRELARLDDLRDQLALVIPHISLTKETARREFLIAPVLTQVIAWTGARVRSEYGLNVSPQLQGSLDYLLQVQRRLLVIEAKREDLTRGFTQLAVELIALDRWLEADEPLLYGAVSTGLAWQFGVLDRKAKHITQDLTFFKMPDELAPVARTLVGILTE